MIPFRDAIPARTRPLVTVAIAVLNVVTVAWLHPLAVAANVFALWLFGPTVEDRMGHGRFVIFYLACAAAAAAAQAAAGDGTIAATSTSAAMAGSIDATWTGAAVAGVIGAYVVLYPRSRILTLVPLPFAVRIVDVPAITIALVWVALELASLGPAMWVHAVGAAVGAGLARPFRRPERMRVEWWNGP